MPYLRLALDVPLDRLFDYYVEAATPADIGRRAVVPFGRRRLIGIVMAMSELPSDPTLKIKSVEAVLSDMPAFPADVLALLQFCASYYHHPIGQTVHTALPGRFRELELFRMAESLHYQAVDAIALRDSIPGRAIMQHRLAALLAQPRSEAELRAVSPSAWKIVQGWVANHSVRSIAALSTSSLNGSTFNASSVTNSLGLNSEQHAAVQTIVAKLQPPQFSVYLLHGITGSGKTEVYLHSIATALAQQQQVLVLVPEINLTPQLEMQFRARFPDTNIISLHSGIADGERAAAWVKAAHNEAAIVLGTRLAVFTPLPNLGLIVVDEEHDASFKQQDGLRYSARDVAIVRAKQANCPVILGSATPSLESWYNADTGRYQRLCLTQRAVAGARPPAWRLIVTRRQPLVEGLHSATLKALGECLARGEQSLVFLNRRGFSPVIHCGECGWLAGCSRCSARLTVHLRERCLRCHHCGLDVPMPTACPDCGNREITPLGHGTQRLEDVLIASFPHAQVLRIDRDSMRRKGSFSDALGRIRGGKADILIGTQMLAKGHDFPKLTLVVILGADNGLYSTDFRAPERLYAQLAQVAGRAGRAEQPGEVLLQTDYPEHRLYQALIADDYAAFAASELAERQLADFPPYVYQAVMRADAFQIADALAFLQQAIAIAPQDEAVTIWDPVATTMMRLANRERAQLLIQSASRSRLQALLQQWVAALRAQAAASVRWSVDVDTQHL